MTAIVNYIFCMLPYMLISVVITFIWILLKYKKNKGINWQHEIALIFFVAFVSGLVSQTIISEFTIDINSGIQLKNIKNSNINLIPFKVLFETYTEVFVNNNIRYLIINFLGNIIMFMPIGFFVPLLWKKPNKIVILIGFVVSLVIEFCQLFLGRGTDVDDLILNTFGAFCGVIVYKVLRIKIYSKKDK